MTQFIVLALLVPAEMRSLADDIAIQLGHAAPGVSTYVTPVVPADGHADAEPTYYGCNTSATPGFALMVQIAKTGEVPEGTNETLAATALGLRQSQPEFFNSLLVSQASLDDYTTCFKKLLSENGLQQKEEKVL